MSDAPAPSQSPRVHGWCPGALRPMMSGDGLVVRVRAPLGRLAQAQASGLADLSARHGNGLIDLSARGNLQIRGIAPDDHPALIEALRDLGLVDHSAEAEARRNVLLAPFWQAGDDTQSIATDLNAALSAATDLTLPGKFGFAVDCGAQPVLQETAADIRIERSSEGALMLRADGAVCGLPVTRESAAAEALALARWFLRQGGAPEGRGRMRPLIARRGPPKAHMVTVAQESFVAYPGAQETGCLAAVEFGQIPAGTLAALADLGSIRLTPWRMLLVERMRDLPALPGLVLDATDPRLRVHVCTGAPRCLQALGPTRDLARQLAPQVPAGKTLHLSGCSKGCAHPRPASLVLTAVDSQHFDFIRDGRASDRPVHRNLGIKALADARNLFRERR